MKFNLYSIYDSVAEEFGPVFCSKNVGVAVRQFKAMMEGLPSSTHDDYKLVELGSFDMSTGAIDVYDFDLEHSVSGSICEEVK